MIYINLIYIGYTFIYTFIFGTSNTVEYVRMWQSVCCTVTEYATFNRKETRIIIVNVNTINQNSFGWTRPKMRLWHRSFPVNFAKFLSTHFLQNTSGRLLQLTHKLKWLLHLRKSYSLFMLEDNFYMDRKCSNNRKQNGQPTQI